MKAVTDWVFPQDGSSADSVSFSSVGEGKISMWWGGRHNPGCGVSKKTSLKCMRTQIHRYSITPLIILFVPKILHEVVVNMSLDPPDSHVSPASAGMEIDGGENYLRQQYYFVLGGSDEWSPALITCRNPSFPGSSAIYYTNAAIYHLLLAFLMNLRESPPPQPIRLDQTAPPAQQTIISEWSSQKINELSPASFTISLVVWNGNS